MKIIHLKIDGMHCASCPIMIDGTLEDTLSGVTSAQTNYAKQTCVVEYDEIQIGSEKIIQAIEKIGYKAYLEHLIG